MKNRLNWRIDGTDVWNNVRRYKAIFDEKVTDDIRFYISYNVFMDNSDEWYLGIIQTAPNRNAKPIAIKCYDPENGKIMAEEHLQEIFDGMKKLLDN